MPGHFHMTVAGPVFLGIIGMSLHLVSKLSGKPVRLKNFAVVVPHLWMIGVLVFSTGLMWGGLIGEPRRTNMGMSYLDPDSPLFRPDWVITSALAVFGGVMMFASAALYFLVVIKTVLTPKTSEPGLEFPAYEVYHDEPRIRLLDNFTPWLIIMILIIAMAYIPAFIDISNFVGPGAPPFSPDNPFPLELNQ
jgi:cytochrome c oxidase subunit 1